MGSNRTFNSMLNQFKTATRPFTNAPEAAAPITKNPLLKNEAARNPVEMTEKHTMQPILKRPGMGAWSHMLTLGRRYG